MRTARDGISALLPLCALSGQAGTNEITSMSMLRMSGSISRTTSVCLLMRFASSRLKTMNSDEKICSQNFHRCAGIITKSALMEGWDCPFAYLLVMLDNTRAQRAITQLVGRVMRQPHAQITDRELLNQCYVYCNNADVGTVVTQVKNGLESEGLTGLGDEVMGASDAQQGNELQKVQQQTAQRREQFREQEIYLPVVRHRDGDRWIQLNYQAHILPHIDWSAIEPPDPEASAPEGVRRQSATVDVGDMPPVFHTDQEPYIDKTVSISDFARRLSDIMPNLWQAARIAQQMHERLRADGETEEGIYDRRSYLAHNSAGTREK